MRGYVMSNTIKKFIFFLRTRQIESELGLLSSKITEQSDALSECIETKKINIRRSLLQHLEIPKEEWGNHSEIFTDFEALSKMLNSSDLNMNEKMEVVFTLIEKNIKAGVIQFNMTEYEKEKIAGYIFHALSRKEVEEIVFHKKFPNFIMKPYYELTELERKQKEEFDYFCLQLSIEMVEMAQRYKSLENHYFNVLDSYTKEDIQKVVEVLLSLKVAENICQATGYILGKKLEKRNNDDIVPHFSSPVEMKKILPKKEGNVLNRELKKYYDSDAKKTTGYLKREDIIYCIHLMNGLQCDRNEIDIFLKAAEKGNRRQGVGSIGLYADLYHKLQFYQNIPEVQAAIPLLNEILGEMMIVNDTDYGEWKLAFEEALNKCLSFIPNDYGYEFVQAHNYEKPAQKIKNKK